MVYVSFVHSFVIRWFGERKKMSPICATRRDERRNEREREKEKKSMNVSVTSTFRKAAKKSARPAVQLRQRVGISRVCLCMCVPDS